MLVDMWFDLIRKCITRPLTEEALGWPVQLRRRSEIEVGAVRVSRAERGVTPGGKGRMLIPHTHIKQA